MMEPVEFHHALKVREEACIGCAHCMRACPTEAIRIRDGKARIINNRCIDCGQCYRVCPVSAITVEQDDFNAIFDFKYRVALLPAVLIGQFPSEIETQKIYDILMEIGFTHVFEVENCVEFLTEANNQYLKENIHASPVISTFCPAIIRLIQVSFPALAENLMLVKPPLDIAALYVRKKLTDSGIPEEETGLFYFTPCAAKIASIKSPVGDSASLISGVINMNSIYNKIFSNLKNTSGHYEHLFIPEQLTNRGMLWSLTNGEAKHMAGRSLAIDGVNNVMEFLEKIENEEVSGIDFLEVRACDQSCAGGILMAGNKFLTVERLRKRAIKYTEQNDLNYYSGDIIKYHSFLLQKSSLRQVVPRSALKLDEDMAKAMEKMKRKQKLMCFLPGFDCGGCGAPNCQALAEDIVQGLADTSHCVFIQKVMQKNRKLSNDHALNIIEKIWGKDRLDKNCNKKGAQNEC